MTTLNIEGLIGWDVEARDIRRSLASAGDQLSLEINSPGGDVHEGIAIYNALRDYKRNGGTIRATVTGIAASMATYIATVADELAVEDNAVWMVHNPWTLALGDHRAMAKAASVLASLRDVLARAYVSRTGRDTPAINAEMDEETWLFGAEIAERGYADSVIPAGDGAETRDHAMAIARSSFTAMRAKLKSAERDDTLDRIAAVLPHHPAAAAATHTTEHTMPETSTKAAAPDSKQPNNVIDMTQAAEQAKAEARAAIQTRNATLKQRFDAFCRAYKGDVDTIRAVYDDMAADLDKTPDQFTDTVLAKLAEGQEPIATDNHTRIEGQLDARDKFRNGVSAVLARRMQIPGAKDERDNEFRGMSLHRLAAASLELSGKSAKGMTASEIASRVLAAHTTSDFPYLLANSANKSLQAAYESFPSTWNMIAATGSVSDFKTIDLVRLGSFNSLDTIPEGAEYTAGTMSEEREQMSVATKGKFIQLTRQMIVNDDLSGFSRMAAMLGRAAARTVNKDVYAVINANGNLSDGAAIFATAKSNLASSGAAISVATLSAGRSAMRKQQDPSGNDYLNIMPRTLLVPVAKEDHAREVVTSTDNTDTTASRKRNPIQDWGPLEIVSDPYLDATSTDAWYLIADPMDVPLLEVRFLDGNQTPFIDDTEEFLTDAIQWKVRLDYGVAANDRRGGYKNAGS